MPRISVDIDLVYVPNDNREDALKKIELALLKIKNAISKALVDVEIIEKRINKDNNLAKLYVRRKGTEITIEPNLVLRGTVYPVEYGNSCDKVNDLMQMSISNVPILNYAELYAGKICAALDRQHPRDLFDIKLLYENEGLTDQVRQAFVTYLASSPRPMHELLNPNLFDFTTTYQSESERKFLLSIKQGKPEYNLMPFGNLDQLPALQWKVMNIRKIEPSKHKEMVRKLRDVLGMS